MKKIVLIFFILGCGLLKAQSLSTGLTACYALNGNANDPINSLNGTLSAVTSTVDRFNNSNSAFLFTGSSSSYIRLPNDPLLKPTGGVSFSSWVKFNSTSSGQYLVFAKNTCGSFHEGYTLSAYNFGPGFKLWAVKSGSGCQGSTQILGGGATTLLPNTWYHAGCYIGNDSIKVYLNGVLDGFLPSNVQINFDALENVYLGGSNLGFNLPLDGTLDNVRFYNRKLSDTEFNLLYTSDPVCVSPPPAAALNFDGLNDYVDIANGNSSFSVTTAHQKTYQVWFKNSIPQGQNVRILSGGNTGGPSTNGLWIGYASSSNVLKLELNDGVGSPLTITGNSPIRGDSTWHQATAVLDGSVASLYVDAALQGTVNISGEATISSPSTSGMAVHIGNAFDNEVNSYFEGSVDEVRIWNRPLCQNEILATKNCELTGTEPGLVAYYKFNQGIAASPNPTVTSLLDATTLNNGTLTNFGLSGVTSNWETPGAVITGVTCTFTPSPPVFVTASSTLVCGGSSVTLAASGANTYTWEPGSLSGASVAVSPSIPTTYTVTGSSPGGCPSSATVHIGVSTGPTVTAQGNPSSVCPGNSSTLTASGALSYTWLPVNLNGTTVVVNPVSATVYTLLGSSGGCASSATVAVNMGMLLSTGASGNLCNNNTVDIYVTPTSTFSVLWTGPGIVGPAANPTITVNAGGTYSVVVTDTVSGCTGTATLSVTDSLTPLSISVTPSFTNACFPGPPVIMLAGSSAAFSWLPASEVTPNTGPLVSVNPSVTTSYTVNGVLGSCSGSAIVTISVNPTPTLITASTTLCAGSVATLSALGASTFSWQPGNLAGPSVTVNPAVSTIYILSGGNGHCVSSTTVAAEVFQFAHVVPVASPPVICIGNKAILSATGAVSYTWHTLGVPPILLPTVTVIGSVTTVFTVTATNSLGCISTATVELDVVNSQAIGIAGSETLICAGESITLTASGGTDYSWLPGNLYGDTVVVTPDVSTNYVVLSGNTFCNYNTLNVFVLDCGNTSFGVTNAVGEPALHQGSFYKINFTVTAINTSTSPLTQVSLNDDLGKTFPYPHTFTILSGPELLSQNSGLTMNPLFNGTSEISLTSPANSVLLPNKRDTVSFTIQLDPHGFQGRVYNSVVGFALDKNNITVSDSSNNGFTWDPDNDNDPTNNNAVSPIDIHLFDLFIPEGFSPDGNGNNDRFVISGLNDRKLKLSIFNRWGNKVYEKDNYDNSWDGTPNAGGVVLGSGKLTEGTYYYIVQFNDGAKESRTGFVVLRY